MAMHENHTDEEAILQDGCEECEERSRSGLAGLLHLDDVSLDILWRRMLNTEYGGAVTPNVAGRYRNETEARLGHQLYLVGCLLQGGEVGVWHLERFTRREAA